MKFPFLTAGEIEAGASELLTAAFGQNSITYPLDLEFLVYDHLCAREHLSFDDEHDLGEQTGDSVLGKMLPFRNRILITVRLRAYGGAGRYRFTVAHEIGHWVLHRPLFLGLLEQTDLFANQERSAVGTTSLERNVFNTGEGCQVPPEEWQANRFAIALLLKDHLLRDAFRRRFGQPPIACWENGSIRAPSLRALSRSLASKRVNGLRPLQDVFGLSTEATAIALEVRHYVVDQTLLL